MKKNKMKSRAILIRINDPRQVEAIEKTLRDNPKMKRSTLYTLAFMAGINAFKGLPY